jgi:hypothetical protein
MVSKNFTSLTIYKKYRNIFAKHLVTRSTLKFKFTVFTS